MKQFFFFFKAIWIIICFSPFLKNVNNCSDHFLDVNMGIFLNQSNLVAMGLSLSCSVIADSLQLMDCCIRLTCLSPSPGACSIWQCYPTILSSVFPFFSCLQSFPASGSFPISQFFASCSQSIGASASASVLPINVQDQFPL